MLLMLAACLNCLGRAKLAVAGPGIQISTVASPECLGNAG
jgi:hypothetical protein